jgi:hypothetical protein
MPSESPHLDTNPVVRKFAMLLLVRINQSVSLWGILNFCLLSDVFSYRLARGIPLKEESSVASTIQGQNSIT